MKKKVIAVTLTLVAGSILFGCGGTAQAINNNKTLIIDNDTKKVGSEGKALQISKENDINEIGDEIVEGDYIIKYDTKEINKESHQIIQYPKLEIDKVNIGKIEEDNEVKWSSKGIKGEIVKSYMNENNSGVRVIKDKKGYRVEPDGELKEIKAYSQLLQIDSSLNRYESYLNGRIDLFWLNNDNKSIGVIDVENDKFYKVNLSKIKAVQDKRISIIGIENNRIYITLSDENSTDIGYFENNKYKSIMPKSKGVKIDFKGTALYSNEKILIPGSVDGNKGIWNYDIKNKKITKVAELDENDIYAIDKVEDKIIITTSREIRIGLIDDNMKISSLTEVTTIDKDSMKNFAYYNNENGKLYINKYNGYEVYKLN